MTNSVIMTRLVNIIKGYCQPLFLTEVIFFSRFVTLAVIRKQKRAIARIARKELSDEEKLSRRMPLAQSAPQRERKGHHGERNEEKYHGLHK